MTTDQQTNSRRSDVIRCEFCGEDYSVTYRKCPFCDDMEYSTQRITTKSKKGGKRQVPTNTRGGGYGGPVEPVRVIGFVLGLILIAAAIYIVISVISPLFSRGSSQTDVSGEQPSVSTPAPDVSVSLPEPDVSVPEPDVSVSTPDPGVVTPIVKAESITLSVQDVTLKPDESTRITAALQPADCDDELVWSSSNEAAAKVAADGTVTNVNTGSAMAVVTITVKAGDVSAECIVRCKPGSTGTPAPDNTNTNANTNTNTNTNTATAAPGSVGTVSGTSTGLLIRTGPGREYEAQDTAVNGAKVTIVENAGNGWYKISYSGLNGKTITGYASADYITVN